MSNLRLNEMDPNSKNTQNSLYNPVEAARIADLLRHAFKPECIILFGSLAGGTPHSDIVAYDILVVTSEEPYYGWEEGKRYLKLKMPTKHREIAYINLYVHSRKFIDQYPSPIFYFAKLEGVVLYHHKQIQLNKPKACNFQLLHGEVFRYFDTFFNLGEQFLNDANNYINRHDFRQGAFLMAQAVLLFYRTLFFVYHRFETDCADLELLHDRLRTVSVDLMLLFDSGHATYISTLPRLGPALVEARFSQTFSVTGKQLEDDYNRVDKMRKIVEEVCQKRLELYKSKVV